MLNTTASLLDRLDGNLGCLADSSVCLSFYRGTQPEKIGKRFKMLFSAFSYRFKAF